VGLTSDKNKLEKYFKELGKLISSFRKEKKYTLEELGFQIGLDRSAMHRIENGKPINLTTIIKLSIVLDKEPKEFFDTSFSFKTNDLGSLINTKKISKKKSRVKKKK
jgi:transcriptional regulator with XRE-family HTH domain